MFCSRVSAQEDEKYVKELGLNLNIAGSVNNTAGVGGLNGSINTEERDFSIGYFSPSYQFITKKGFVNRFDLTDLYYDFSKTETVSTNLLTSEEVTTFGGKVYRFGIGADYSIGKKLLKKERFSFSLLLNSGLGFATTYNIPLTQTSYPTEEQSIGLTFGLAPEVDLHITDRVDLVTRFVWDLIGLGMTSTKVENPLIRSDHQRVTGFDLNAPQPNGILGQIGINVKL